MSEEKEVSQSAGEDQTGANQVNVSEVLERLKALEATNARLLDESKKTKSKYQETLSKYESAEKEKLEKEGNFQVLLEKEMAKNNSLMEEMVGMKKKVLSSNIRSTVSKFASDVYDLEDLLNQPKFSSILSDGIDENSLTVSEDKAKEYVAEVLKAKPYMKKTANVPSTVDTKPSFVTGEGKTKSIDEMDSSELEALIKAKFS